MGYLQYFGIYFLIINIITFLLWGIDKYKARKHYRRISEKNLLKLILIGGFIGGILGMQFFRHKTIKGNFLWKFWLIVVLWIAIFIWWGMKYL